MRWTLYYSTARTTFKPAPNTLMHTTRPKRYSTMYLAVWAACLQSHCGTSPLSIPEHFPGSESVQDRPYLTGEMVLFSCDLFFFFNDLRLIEVA